MLKKTKQTYHFLFPPRQLLIRQEGEIKYISASARLQFTFALALVACLVWFAFSSFENFILNNEITVTNSELDMSQNTLSELSLTYREKHNSLLLKLEQVEKQQKLLQNVLDSMPSSIIEKEANAVLDAANKGKEVEKDLKAGNSFSAEPLGPINVNTDNVLAGFDLADIKINMLKSLQLENRSRLTEAIEHREKVLREAVLLAGVTPNILLDNLSQDAQGGPLANISVATMSTDNHNILNKLVSLLNLESSVSNVPLLLPAKKYYISSRFGIRSDPMMKRPAMHKGIDMAGWLKTKIYAPANGVVSRAGRNGSYGLFIEIDHENGFKTRYGHLHSLKVKKGQQINKDDIIGLMGSTGRSTSTHLHYEILFDNKQINPLKLIKAMTNVL